MLTEDMVLWAKAQQGFIDRLQASWKAELELLWAKENSKFFDRIRDKITPQWNYHTELVIKGIIKQHCISLAKEHKELTLGFVDDAHRIGFELADYWIGKVAGQTSISYQLAPKAQQSILHSVWDRQASYIYKNCIAVINRLELQSNKQRSTKLLTDCLITSIKEYAWRADRIIRTELSAALHSGVLERLILCPAARKVLLNSNMEELEDTPVLVQFHYGGGSYWTPPSHPNSRALMVGYLPET